MRTFFAIIVALVILFFIGGCILDFDESDDSKVSKMYRLLKGIDEDDKKAGEETKLPPKKPNEEKVESLLDEDITPDRLVVQDVEKVRYIKGVEVEIANVIFHVYTVEDGDTLTKIAKKFNTTVSAIKKANPVIKKDEIFLQQKLFVPSG